MSSPKGRDPAGQFPRARLRWRALFAAYGAAARPRRQPGARPNPHRRRRRSVPRIIQGPRMTQTLAAPGGATHLECTRCGARHGARSSSASRPAARSRSTPATTWTRSRARCRATTWPGARGPVALRRAAARARPRQRRALGEGWTPLIETPRLAARAGRGAVWVKDEGQNPTASFKARGLCMAVSRAKELGVDEVALPSAGNAGSAAAAYAAAAGMAAHVVVPRDTPRADRGGDARARAPTWSCSTG